MPPRQVGGVENQATSGQTATGGLTLVRFDRLC